MIGTEVVVEVEVVEEVVVAVVVGRVEEGDLEALRGDDVLPASEVFATCLGD